MNKCTSCDYTTDKDQKFCPQCGNPMAAEAPAEEAAPVSPAAPDVTAAPAAKPANNGKAITAMVLSALGMACCVPGLGTFSFNLLALLLGIVGIILSKQCIKEGDTSTFSSLGLTFGKIAIIVTCVDLVITAVIALLGFLATFATSILGFLGTVLTAILPAIFMMTSG